MQARLIAGHAPKTPVPDEELLAEAKDRLVNALTVFGITERFDESLLLFNDVFGWNVRGYLRINVTRNRPALGALTPTDLEVIRQHSTIDLALYAFTRERFQERLAAQPPEFAARVAALRRNAKLAQIVNRVRDGIEWLARSWSTSISAWPKRLPH